jgi:anti-sigma factor RsiW
MPNPIQTEVPPHHDAEELLPWYATGQLEGDELALVEQHLSGCAYCRRQLAFERRMVDEFAAMSPEVDSGWTRLKQQLEAPVPQEPRVIAVAREGWRDKVANDAAALWQTFSRPAIAALAAAQLAFVGIAGTLLYSLSQPAYQTLSSAPPPQSANVIAMFRADTTESQISQLLRSNGAALVGGPTPTDAYLLRVPAVSRQSALNRLRSDRHVLLAQPIDGAKS